MAAETAQTPIPVTTLPPSPIPTPTTTRMNSPQHIITIEAASDGIQIVQKEHKEWYQEGPWPLIGSVVVILVTNIFAIGMVYLQSSRSFNALLRQRKIDFLSSSLNDFYNPLLAFIEVNGEIFAKTGPSTFPEEHHEREAAALVWKEIKKKIVENNREIELILKSKTHLMHQSDSLDSYKALIVHVAMYETFQKVETDRYVGFLFPSGVKRHIVAKRSSVLDEFHALSGEQI
jgi:transcription termination factor NusB